MIPTVNKVLEFVLQVPVALTFVSLFRVWFFPTGFPLAVLCSIAGNLTGLLGALTETEREMISVERMDEYCRADGEYEPPGGSNTINTISTSTSTSTSSGHSSNNNSSNIGVNSSNTGIEDDDEDEDDYHRNYNRLTDHKAETLSSRKVVGQTAAAATRGSGVPLSPDWPARGRLEVSGLVMRYRRGLSPALDGVNLAARAGEKVRFAYVADERARVGMSVAHSPPPLTP